MGKIKSVQKFEPLDPHTYMKWLLAKIYQWGTAEEDDISHNIEALKSIWYEMGGRYAPKTKAQMLEEIREVFGDA